MKGDSDHDDEQKVSKRDQGIEMAVFLLAKNPNEVCKVTSPLDLSTHHHCLHDEHTWQPTSGNEDPNC